MADVKISQLPAATTPLAGDEEVPLVQSGTTKKATVNDIAAAAGAVTAVTATSPLASSGGKTPNLSIPKADATTSGYLSSTDWNTFNNKQPAGSYLTSGGALGTPSSGTATNLTGLPLSTGVTGTLPVANGGTGTATPSLVAGTNVSISGTWPNQTINSTGGGTGTVTSASVVSANGLAGTVANPTTTPAITLSTTVTGIVKGNGTALSAATAGTDYVAPGGALGTPSSGTLTNATGLPLITGVTGILPVANGGSGTATPSLVAGTNVTISGTWPNQTINSTGGGSGMVYPGAGIPNSTGAAWGTSYSTSGSGTVIPLQTSATLITPTLSGATVDNAAPYLNFATGAGTTVAAGRMWYDGTTGSWNLGMGGGNITQQVGEELFVYGKASAALSGNTILQAVYQTGTVGASGVVTFAPTVAGITNSNLILGVATEDIATNGFGRITTFGVVHSIDTTGSTYGETWADGDVIWYNPTTGGLTKTKPTAPNIKVQLGIVTHAGSGGSGSFQVLINPGSSLGGTDSNVNITSVANGNLLQYDSTAQYWKNVAPSSVTGVGSLANALTIGTGLSGTSYNGSSAVTVAIDSTVATLSGAQTLTNKTISGASNTLSNIGNASLTNSSVTVNGTAISLGASGTVTVPISTGVTGLGTGVATALGTAIGSAGAPVVNGGVLGTPSSGTLTNATGLPLSTGVTGTLSVSNGGTGATTLTGLVKGNGTSAFTAATAGTDYVAPGTATTFTATQTFSGSSSTFAASLLDANETVNVVAAAPSATTNFYIQSGAVQYYTSNAANNWTLNIAFSSGTLLNTALATGQSVTGALITTQGSTAYYANSITIDGTATGVTTKWIGGAPTAGNASGLDVVRFSVIKTASATYTVLLSLTQYK